MSTAPAMLAVSVTNAAATRPFLKYFTRTFKGTPPFERLRIVGVLRRCCRMFPKNLSLLFTWTSVHLLFHKHYTLFAAHARRPFFGRTPLLRNLGYFYRSQANILLKKLSSEKNPAARRFPRGDLKYDNKFEILYNI